MYKSANAHSHFRKDADILFYEIRGFRNSEGHRDYADYVGLLDVLQGLGIVLGKDYGFIHKATFEGRPIDFMFPERRYDVADTDIPEGADADQYGLHART